MDQLTLQELRAIPLFSDLSGEQTRCFEPGEIIQLEAGKVLMSEGDAVDFFYVLLAGEMRASRNYSNQAILMDRRDTSFAGTADEVTDEEVIFAIRSVPCHY